MKTYKTILLATMIIVVGACSSSKKSSSAAAPATTNMKEDLFSFTKLSNGIIPPRNEELIAIQIKYNDVTMDKLKEGHAIYTGSSCRSCHGVVNIYKHNETNWKKIIDDMATRAALSDQQKDAVYKYVLAIKATQPKIE